MMNEYRRSPVNATLSAKGNPMKHLAQIFLSIAIAVSFASIVSAATVTLSPNGNGRYTVNGDSMGGVAGIDLTIGYDPARLSGPTVTWGPLIAGAVSIANTNIPGSIRIAIVKPEPFAQSSGVIATISFAAEREACGILQLSAKLINEKTLAVPVQAAVAGGAACGAAPDAPLSTTPGVPFSQTASSGTTSSTAGSNPSQGVAGLGSVRMPGESQAVKEERPAEKAAPPPSAVESAPEAATAQSVPAAVERSAEPVEAPVSQTAYVGVIERFRSFRGERSTEAMLDLFAQPVAPDIRQEPSVVISDGKSTARVSLDLTVSKGAADNISLIGATLVSLKNGDDKGRMVIDLMPQYGVTKSVVTIVTGRAVIEYPLTVVPPVKAVAGSRAEFASFIKDSGSKEPKYDLNGDGRHDYQDDFIYTGHYLLQTSKSESKKAN